MLLLLKDLQLTNLLKYENHNKFFFSFIKFDNKFILFPSSFNLYIDKLSLVVMNKSLLDKLGENKKQLHGNSQGKSAFLIKFSVDLSYSIIST